VSVVMKPRAMVHVDGCYRPEPRGGKMRSGPAPTLAQASEDVKLPHGTESRLTAI